jgi:hypothetical protein
LALGLVGLVQVLPTAAQAAPPGPVEPLSEQFSVQMSGWQTREWSAQDEHGPWTEFRRGQRLMFQRTYSEGANDWFEALEGTNHWRYRAGGYAGLAEEAAARGGVSLELGEGPPVQVLGAPSQRELELIRGAFLDLPTAMRPYARRLYLSQHLGEIFDPQGQAKPVRGLSGNQEGGIVLDRDYFQESDPARVIKNLLAHESGHNLDRVHAASNKALWKNSGSVSEYGERNPSEDFAETHRFVLENWATYQKQMLVEGTAVEGTRLKPDRAPSEAKARVILDLLAPVPMEANPLSLKP